MTTQLNLSAETIAKIIRANNDKATFNFKEEIATISMQAAWDDVQLTPASVERWLTRYLKKKNNDC
jgi:hypothetical protein